MTSGAPEPCVADDTLLAFARGDLDPAALEKVEAHVDVCPACSAVLATAVTDGARAQSAARPRLLAGTSLPTDEIVARRYRIVRLLGRGGMGEVYEAEDLQLGARVALKTVSAALSDDPKAFARLRREVELARRIDHPNVCRMHDIVSWERGLVVTMELLAGESLGDLRRRRGRLEPPEVAALLPQIVAGIAAAHAAGVVHRDFKPDNVMLCPAADGGAPRVVVMDFGLARPLVPDPHLSVLTTDEKQILGSPAYLAPEQVSPSGSIGPGTDIYALGVVLYELLTGALPFKGTTPLATALLRLEAPAPSPRSIVPALDRRWAAVVGRCLRRRPKDRFASVAAVLPALAGPIPAAARRGRWALVAAAAAVVAAAVALLLGT